MNSIQDIWNGIMEILSGKLTTTSINTWFAECTPIDLKDGTLIIYTKMPFKRDILHNRFEGEIKDALREIFSCDFDLLILAGDELDDYRREQEDTKKAEQSLPEMDGYTFENFIVGKSNEYAYAAAQGVVKNPGSRVYNPLFIYGNSGLGKTHLLCAIGTAIHEANPNAKLAFVKGDDFTNQMVRSIKEGTADEFRQKYRGVDLFLVDDIQFIAGREATQEEFFHTFNSIYEAGHQIVITSDRPPIDMLRLDDRLRTRFEGGMMADVQPPDVETRMAIIRNKAGLLGMQLSDDIVSYIAQKITANVRQIEGVINRLTALQQISNEPVITREIVDRAIGDVVRDGVYVPTPEVILNETARFFQVSADDVKGMSRQKSIMTARHITAYLIRNLTNLSLPGIGTFLNRDHATVLASIRKIENQIKSDKKLSDTIRDITSNINSRQ